MFTLKFILQRKHKLALLGMSLISSSTSHNLVYGMCSVKYPIQTNHTINHIFVHFFQSNTPYCYKSNAPNDPHKDHVVSMEGKWKRLDLNLYDKQSEYIYAEFEWSLKGTIMGARDQDHKHLDSFFPQSNDSLKDSGWDAVLRWGYLKSFFPQKRRMSRHDFIDLKWDLLRIQFSTDYNVSQWLE